MCGCHSLLKSRHDPTFRASSPVALLPETPGDVVFVRIGSEESQVSLDSEGRIVQILWAGSAPFDSSKRASIRVTYSDSRTVTGLTLPFASAGWIENEKVSATRLDSVLLNEEVDARLFAIAVPSMTPAATPGPR